MDVPEFTSEVLSNLVHNQHACRMLAAMGRLGIGNSTEWLNQLVAIAPVETIRPVLYDNPCEEYTREWLSKGLLSPEKIAKQAVTVAAFENWDAAAAGVASIDLANPLISAESVRSILGGISSKSPCVAALKANPNCPPELRSVENLTYKDRENHTIALAQYGNLQDREVHDALITLIVEAAPSGPPKYQHAYQAASRFLCTREDLTESLVLALDSKCSPHSYKSLAKHPLHQIAVIEGKLTGVSAYRNGEAKAVSLSPSLTSELIHDMFHRAIKTPDEENLLCALAAHKNAGVDLVKHVLETPSLEQFDFNLLSRFVEGKSPHAERVYDHLKINEPSRIFASTMSRWSTAPPHALLDVAAEELEKGEWAYMTMVTSNPNFPWDKAGSSFQKEINSQNPEVSVANCCRAASGGLPGADALGCLDGKKSPLPILFARTTIGAKLERIAELEPELAGLAALHPNGGSIALKSILPKHRQIVVSLQIDDPTFELPGRATEKLPTFGEVLSI